MEGGHLIGGRLVEVGLYLYLIQLDLISDFWIF